MQRLMYIGIYIAPLTEKAKQRCNRVGARVLQLLHL